MIVQSSRRPRGSRGDVKVSPKKKTALTAEVSSLNGKCHMKMTNVLSASIQNIVRLGSYCDTTLECDRDRFALVFE